MAYGEPIPYLFNWANVLRIPELPRVLEITERGEVAIPADAVYRVRVDKQTQRIRYEQETEKSVIVIIEPKEES